MKIILSLAGFGTRIRPFTFEAPKPLLPVAGDTVLGWNSLFPYLNNTIKKDIKTKGEYQLTDSLRMMLEREGISIEQINIKGWFDCGTKTSLLETNAALSEDYQEKKAEIDWIKKPCYIHDSGKIKNSIIGPNVSIGSGSVIENSCIKNLNNRKLGKYFKFKYL